MKEILIPLNFTKTPVLYDSKQSFSASDEESGVLTFTTTADVTGTVASLTIRSASENANRQTVLIERLDVNSSPFRYAVKMPLPFGNYEGEVLLKKNLTVLASATFLFGVNSSLSAEILPKLVEAYSLDNLVEEVETEVSNLKDAYTVTVSETVKGVNKTESTLQLSENVRYLNESTRKANELLRIYQENARVVAEEGRVTAFGNLVNSAIIEQTVTQEVAEKYQEIEATQANRLLSVESELAESKAKSEVFAPSKRHYTSLAKLTQYNTNIADPLLKSSALAISLSQTSNKPYPMTFIGDSLSERLRLSVIKTLEANHELNGLGFSTLTDDDRANYGAEKFEKYAITTLTNDATTDNTWGIAARRHRGKANAWIKYRTYMPYVFTDYKIFYQKSPTGGKFYYQTDKNTTVEVDTYSATEDLGFVTINNLPKGTHQIYLYVTLGTVDFFGVYTYQANANGVIPSFINKGGSYAMQWATRMNYPKKFMDEVGFNKAVVWLGANDAAGGSRLATLFDADMRTIVGAINPSEIQDVVLLTYMDRGMGATVETGIRTLDTAFQTLTNQYVDKLKLICSEFDYSLFDLKKYFPTRATAWDMGLYADIIHHSDLGCLLTAEMFVEEVLPKKINKYQISTGDKKVPWESSGINSVKGINFGVSGDAVFSGGVLLPNNKIMCITRTSNSNRLAFIDLVTKEVTYDWIDYANFSGGVVVGDYVYLIPTNELNVGKYNWKTGKLTTIALPSPYNVVFNNKWVNGTLAQNGKIYCSPWSANHVLIIDTATDTLTLSAQTVSASVYKTASAVLAPNGYVYMAPMANGNVIYKINPTDNTLSEVAVATNNEQFNGGCVAVNGNLYFAPANSGHLLKVNPTNDSITLIGTGIPNSRGIVAAPDGLLYLIPSSNTSVTVFDPTTDTVVATLSVTALGTSWCGGVYAPNGKVYGVPYNALNALEIEIKMPKYVGQYFESPFFNKY